MLSWKRAAVDVVVNNCEGCGAPLPAGGVCTFCGRVTHVDGALSREQASRREAEALYATLGEPPRWWQRVAVWLTNPWLWLLGFPFLIGIFHALSSIPSDAFAAAYERLRHARMMHVAPAWLAWLLDNVWSAAIAVTLLVLSLFGERVDARRDLQAALASKPPRTDGGPACCRNCDAALVVPAGALGVRCAACGADNLVRVPADWARRADKIDASLHLGEALAKKRAAVGRRQVRRAALWRVPLVVVVLVLLALPAWLSRRTATWHDFRYPDLILDVIAIWQHGSSPSRELRIIPRCELDAAWLAHYAPKARLALDDSRWCEWQRGRLCDLVVMVPLAAGETLRLAAPPEQTKTRLALAPRWYSSGVGVLWDGFGDEVPIDRPVAISGWYKLDVLGAPGVSVQPCVASAPRSPK